MSRILCVGIAALDIVNLVNCYPAEDSKVRALGQQRRLGGNAANTAIVLAQLGHAVTWVGSLGDQPDSALVHKVFANYGVRSDWAQIFPGASVPSSYVILSRENGSRSIVHYRDLPEYPADAFAQLDLSVFDWIHFEGRAIDQLGPMLQRARQSFDLPLSLEVEKPRKGIESLFDMPDFLMFSRDYALAQGVQHAAPWLESMRPGIKASCTWGRDGAWARDAGGIILHVGAYHPPAVVDTLGAGDVFNAGLIHGMTRGLAMQETLQLATRLAGEKCGHEGLHL